MAEKATDGAGHPRVLVYAGTDSGYFEEWRRHLVAPGDFWVGHRCGDVKEAPSLPGPLAAVFVDLLSPPVGLNDLLAALKEAEPELPLVLLTGLTPSLEEAGGWNAMDSVHRKDWIRLRALTRWIADRCNRTDALRSAANRLESVMSHVSEALALLRDGDILEANPAFRDLFGPSPQPNPEGRGFIELLHPEDRTAFTGFLKEARETGAESRVELRILRSDSAPRIEITAFPVPGRRNVVQILLREPRGTTETQEELRRARNTLASILGAVSNTVTVASREGKLVYANLKAAREMGFNSVEELLHTDPRSILERFEILDEQGRPFPVEKLPNRLVFQGETPTEPVLLQWRNRKTSDIQWSLLTVAPILDAEGSVSMVVSTAQNVTALKRAEIEIKESEERLRTLSETVQEGIALVSDGRIMEVNSAFAEMFGMSHFFFRDMQPERFFHPSFQSDVRRAISGDSGKSFEGLAHTPGGRDFPVLIRGRRGIRRGRRFEILAVRNLTPERRLQEEFSHLFELSPDLICILGYDGYFKRLSPSWERTLGYSLDELYARPYTEFLHPEDLPPTHRAVENANEERFAPNFENRYRCKDGSYRWLQWNGCNLPGGDQMLGIGRDVTEDKRRRRDFQESQHRLHEHSRTMDLVLGRVLRTLRDSNAAMATEFLEELEALIGFEGGPSPSLEEFDISELLQEMLGAWEVETGQIRPELLLDPKMPRLLRSDPARLRFSLTRLTHLWSLSGGGRRPWRLGVLAQEMDADQLWVEHRLECAEEGETKSAPMIPGMDAELALLLCGAWVRKLGGRLHHAALLPGAFRFSLPFPLQPSRASEGKEAPSLLLVEDHPMNQRLMLELLKILGPYRVTLAATGLEAVRAHAAGTFDLVLMDYHLPGVDGAEAARMMRAAEEKTGVRVPIIAVTADALENSRRVCLDAGMDDFLTKPVLLRDLSETLERWKRRKIDKAAASA